jgi:hypothetical protein
MQSLAARFPTLATYVPSIGKSHEGRAIPVLYIAARPDAKQTHLYAAWRGR